MSPVFRRESEYTFKIYSNEEERMHIHVLCGGHEAKYWLESEFVKMGLSKVVDKIKSIVRQVLSSFGCAVLIAVSLDSLLSVYSII